MIRSATASPGVQIFSPIGGPPSEQRLARRAQGARRLRDLAAGARASGWPFPSASVSASAVPLAHFRSSGLDS